MFAVAQMAHDSAFQGAHRCVSHVGKFFLQVVSGIFGEACGAWDPQEVLNLFECIFCVCHADLLRK